MQRRTYTTDQLRFLSNKPCVCLCRRVRRRLFYFNLLKRHIPTITTSRKLCQTKPESSHHLSRPRCLIHVKRELKKRLPRKRQIPLPNLLLTNVQSLGNKLDEVSLLLKRQNPDIAAFTETWLDHTYGESSITMENYVVIRKDRAHGRGGGIVCYARNSYSLTVIGEHEIPSLNSLKSELLCVFVEELFLIFAIVYHPFWNDNSADAQAISCLVDIVDFAFIRYGQNVRILLCGDLMICGTSILSSTLLHAWLLL